MKFLWITALVFFFDQFTKQLVRSTFEYGESVSVLGDELLRWTYIENPGMAFGIDPGNKMLFSLFTIAIVLWLMYYYWTVRNQGLRVVLPLAIVLGGAFGNMFDRLFYGVWFQATGFLHGRVVDFIDFNIPDIDLFGITMNRWPVFNIADIAVSVGVAFLILFYKPEETKITEFSADNSVSTTSSDQ